MHIKNKRIELPCQVFVYYSPNAIIYTRRVFFLWCIVSAVNGRWDPARSVCIDESPLQPVDKINPPLQLATGSNNYRQQVVSGQLWSFMQYSKNFCVKKGASTRPVLSIQKHFLWRILTINFSKLYYLWVFALWWWLLYHTHLSWKSFRFIIV